MSLCLLVCVGQVMVPTFTNELQGHPDSAFALKMEPTAALKNGVTRTRCGLKATVARDSTRSATVSRHSLVAPPAACVLRGKTDGGKGPEIWIFLTFRNEFYLRKELLRFLGILTSVL